MSEDSEDGCSSSVEENMFEAQDNFRSEYDDFIHPYLNVSILNVLQMVLVFFMRHNLTAVALEDLLLLINTIVENPALPTTKHLFFKLFGRSNQPKYNFFCDNCDTSLEVDTDIYEENVSTDSMQCQNCQHKHTFNRRKENNWFLSFSLESQLKDIISNNSACFLKDEIANDLNVLRDIHDGEIYKNKTNIEKREITLTLNTDGVQVFKSKSKSLWPVQLIVNNLKPIVRFKTTNILVTALWFHTKHPNMKVLLKPLMKEIVELRKNGLLVTIGDETYDFNVSILCSTLDAPAKAAVQNIMQHNGFYSCNYCEHPGETINTTVKYPNQTNMVRRMHESATKQMLQAREKNLNQFKRPGKKTKLMTVNGFKGI